MTILNQTIRAVLIAGLIPLTAMASSHREAPLITGLPKVDGTDFYMFSSYETGREDFVTLLANYVPLQDPYGGPNYFELDDSALYEIHIDNNGDAMADITFQFTFSSEIVGFELPIGGANVPIPLKQKGPIGPAATDTENLNVIETYRVNVVRGKAGGVKGSKAGGAKGNQKAAVTLAADGSATFRKPVDNIGNKTLPQYAAYANEHIYDVNIPSCGAGRLFVGQRKESFVVNLGELFDLINLNPLGPVDGEPNALEDKNITTLALEVPASCLTAPDSSIIGGWTTASVRHVRLIDDLSKMGLFVANHGSFNQVSRLGSPLVNEVVIGLPDKDHFNSSEPANDGQFALYVTNPTLPALIELLFPVEAPDFFPRTDLVAAFLTGVEGLNQPADVVPSEMLRLNTEIPAAPAGSQEPLGVLAGDLAGFPNGRRPGDDVVDIALRVMMGVLLPVAVAPDGQLDYTDGAYVDSSFFDVTFPYLVTPIPGSPNENY